MHIKKYTEKDRYGNMFSYEFDVPSLQEIPQPDPSIFKPKGTDTVPAMLTPGENVVNAEASRLPGVQPMLDNLNDMGRAIQKKQGGPIPSYNADGGQIQYAANGDKISIPNPTITEEQLIKAYDKYLEGFAGSTNTPHTYDDFKIIMLDHYALKFNQGGQVPMYSAAGDFIIDDTMLDAIRQVESGGDINAVSEVGASGPYQIMKATALKPGYGVTPIGLDDRFDPEKSRAFAKQYLQGIMRANPDFTRDEVITAYHSGAGNVRKAKMGQEELGPRGQAYFGKVKMAMNENEVPMPIARPVVFDDTPMESGFMSAQASTGENEIPEPVNQDMYNGMNPKEIKRFELGVDDDIILDSSGGVQPVNPNRVAEDIPKKLAEKFAKDGNEKSYNFYMEDYKQALKQDQAYKKYIADKEAADKEAKFIEKSGIVANKTKELDAKIEEAKKNNNPTLVKALEDEKEKQKQSLIPGSVNNTSPDLKQLVNTLVTKTNSSPQIKENINKVAEEGAKKAKADPTTYDYIKGFFSQFFDTQELTRAALIYLGSRALGYEHGSSINYVGKNYLKRIDIQMDANKKWANSKAATDNYEQSSIQRFLINGDRNELVKKGSIIKKPLTPMFDRNTQKVVQMFELADGTTAARIDGKLVSYPSVAGRLDTLDPKIHDSTTIKNNFAKASKDYVSYVNKDIDEEKRINEAEISKISNQAESLLRDTMKNQKFKKNTVARAEVISELEAAMGDYYEAYKRFLNKEDKAKKPSSLKEFFDKRMINTRTDGIWDSVLVKGTSAERLQEVQNKLVNMLELNIDASEPASKKVRVAENFQNQLKSIWTRYSKMSDKDLKDKGLRKNFIRTKTEGMNDFINWVNQVLSNNPDALKIISALEKE